MIRAIGDPHERFDEDRLRMLRAVRFASTLDFTFDEATLEAVRRMAPGIPVVSAERIAEEMRRILVDPHRARGVRLIVETGLAEVILPELRPADRADPILLDHSLNVIDRFRGPGFPLVLAALLSGRVDAAGARAVCQRWRLSNKETDRTVWLVQHRDALGEARSMRWSALQPVLMAPGAEDLLAMEEAEAGASGRPADTVAWCRSRLEPPREELDPPPLLTGEDLIRHGVSPGPLYRVLLERVRHAQLDGEVETKREALDLADGLLEEHEGGKD